MLTIFAVVCNQHHWVVSTSSDNKDSSSMDLDGADNTKKFISFIPINPPLITAGDANGQTSTHQAADIRNAVASYQELTKVIAFIETKALEVNLQPKKEAAVSTGSSNFATAEKIKSQI